MTETAVDKMTKAKTWLINNVEFFSFIAVGLEYINTDDAGLSEAIPTMATDGRCIWWNPKFVEKISFPQCAAVIMHEVMHVCWLHHLRRGHRDPKIWNFACDYAINYVVTATLKEDPRRSSATLPGKPSQQAGPNPDPDEFYYLYDEKYKDKSAYEIYEELIKDIKVIKVNFSANGTSDPQKGKQDDGDTPLWGTVIDATNEDGSPLSDGEKATVEAEIKIKVQQAAEAAKARGKLPACLGGLIKAVGAPKVNWKDYIQTWVSGQTPDDYTYSRPNRRMMANFRVYMPRMRLNGAGVGVLSVDTSGSVSDNELIEYVREIAGVIELCNPDKLYIIQHDAIIQNVREWSAGDEFKDLKVKGRGGTCIAPVFKKILTLDDPIDWMICFTDMGIGDYPSPEKAPDFPVLWCATGPDNAPFGTYLPLKDAMNG